MPFRNEARHLPAVLATLAAQAGFARERIFLVAVDNGSTDGGAAIVRAWLRDEAVAGEVVEVAEPSIPAALNAGLRRASPQDAVVRLDAHTRYAPDYLATIDAAFAALPAAVWCVGGAPTPEAASADYGSALGIALYTNPLGLGPADYRRRDAAPRRVASVYLGAWRPGVLARLRGYDERWRANEDGELAERVAEAGGEVWRIPVRCERLMTRGPLATIAQWTGYGFWRMQTFRAHPAAVRPRHLAPPLAVLGGLALLASPLRRLAAPLAALYVAGIVALRREGEPARVTAGAACFFPLVHAGYGLGLLRGALLPPAALRRLARARR